MILDSIRRAQRLCPGRPVQAIVADLGLDPATYYRWREREAAGQLADRVVVPHRPTLPPTPGEVHRVCNYALAHPEMGYKRLTFAMIDRDVAYLRAWLVYAILSTNDLLGRRAPAPEALVRPPEADHPDQRWHTDLSLWWFGGQWFWLVDVLDAYSRYLVHCELLLTARANETVLVTQRAIETLQGRGRCPGEPEIVHDGGPQFIGHEWTQFVQAVGMTDVRTRPYHPQSNGRDERVHRTFREELTLDEQETLYAGRAVLADYRTYYNEQRPHSALRYLCPVDYYRGDPAARLAEREAKLQAAVAARKVYWETHR